MIREWLEEECYFMCIQGTWREIKSLWKNMVKRDYRYIYCDEPKFNRERRYKLTWGWDYDANREIPIMISPIREENGNEN